MKIKKLLAAALLFCSAGAWAQTNVTSTYLDNADFSQGTLASPAITTYDYDMDKNNTTFCNLVDLESWIIPTNGNGKAGGPVAIGSGVWIGGEGYTAPPTNSDGEVTGNVLGIVSCWGATAQYTQTLKQAFPAGTYTIVLGVYNSKGGTNAIATNLIGFVEEGGTKLLATTKQYPVNTWKYEFLTFELTAETSGYVTLGYTATNTGSGNMPHLFISGLEIYNGALDADAYAAAKEEIRKTKEAKVLWDNAVKAANEALANDEYAIVTGADRTALEAELAKAEPTTVDDYNAATQALNDALSAFTAAKASYDALKAEIAYAKTFGVPTTAAEAALVNPESTSTTVVAATQTLKVLEYTSINAAYANDVTSLLGTWDKGNYDTTSSQGYVGSETYFDKWSGSAMDMSSSATVTLPAGKYVVKVAGRGHTATTMNLSVKVGEEEAVSTPFLMIGDTGKGIDVDGVTNFSDEATYSNNGTGRGWQYRYIAFETDGTAEVKIAINGHLVGSSWQSFYAPVLLCDDATYNTVAVVAAKKELTLAIENAPVVPTANVGIAAFQLPAAGVQEYANAISAAMTVRDYINSTLAEIEQAKTDFETAIAAYNALELNAPADGQLFALVLRENGDWSHDGKAVTFIANGRTGQGGYNIQYKAVPNKNMAQAFTFTKVSGNNYKLSQIDADGAVRYVSTGTIYSGDDYQLRTTTNADEALAVTVIPTATAGIYNLRNTAANAYIGSQDAGFFTVNSHINFQIVETTKPSVTVNTTAAGYGTVIFPFNGVELPSGVTANTVAIGADGKTLVLTPAETIKANTPYVIEGAVDQTFTGDAQGAELTYESGLLTGVYAETLAPVGSYVLQNLNNQVAFYQVADGAQPTVKANRAYLTVPAGSEVKAFVLGGNADAIQTVETETAQNGAIYNLAGQRVEKAVKGIYVINGKKVVIK